MKRRTPPFEAIEAFVVAAHEPNFKSAAAHLDISASALSRRIQALEYFLGQRLFFRLGNAPVITAAGRRYLGAVQPAIETVRNATQEIGLPRRERSLRVMASHSLALSWLLPRLLRAECSTALSRIDLRIGRDAEDLRRRRIDVAIVGAAAQVIAVAEFPHERLSAAEVGIVGAPDFLRGRDVAYDHTDIAKLPLLEPFDPPGLWNGWLARAFGADASALPTVQFDTVGLVYEAAAAGLGLALAFPMVVDRYLDDSRLVRWGARTAPLDAGYWVLFADHEVQARADVRAFVAWVREQLQAGTGVPRTMDS